MSNTIIYLVTAMQSESEESNDSRRFSVFSLKSLFLSIKVICSFILASFLVPWLSGECELIVKLLDKIKAFSKMNSSFWSPAYCCYLLKKLNKWFPLHFACHLIFNKINKHWKDYIDIYIYLETSKYIYFWLYSKY